MITVYAIIASLLLGAFLRHNFHEILAAHKARKFIKKIDAQIAQDKKSATTPLS